ncbi:MAG: hypothetical protein HYY26_03965 [Acidobacteria bacterium]|nr:hypothetical protein [Acidobacteriota bacterium]
MTPRLAAVALCLLISFLPFFAVVASDHSDAPQAMGITRQDANLTDLHAFVVGSNLVLALAMNPAIPPTATGYVFPTDLTFEISIDVDSEVSPSDPLGDGGTIVRPERISEDIVFRLRFRNDGSARIQRIVRGPVQCDPHLVNFFAGLRDDPFIRGPRQGRNIAAIVLELPLSSVLSGQSTLLIWATAKVEGFDSPFQELAGRSLRSMFPEQAALNRLHPKHHLHRAGLRPDVMIYNTALPAAFPNGRALADDVVDLVCSLSGDCRVVGSDAPFPSSNDVPFLTTFPYLAPPHPAP